LPTGDHFGQLAFSNMFLRADLIHVLNTSGSRINMCEFCFRHSLRATLHARIFDYNRYNSSTDSI